MNIKYLKCQYSLMHLFYWACSCILGNFAVVYLQDKGLSNTLIGIVIGGAAFLSIFAQPYVAQLVESIVTLNVKKMMQIIIVILIVLFALVNMVSTTKIIIMFLYMSMCTLNYCMQTLLNAMGMEYIDNGYPLDYGFARGIGSLSLALSAIVLGFVLEVCFPKILGNVYIGLSAILLLLVTTMPDSGRNVEKREAKIGKQEDKTSGKAILGNRALVCVLIGFCLANVNNGAVGTYMIDIVKERGGTESILGIANFIACFSEVPIMMMSAMLVKKFDSIRLLKISAFFFWLKPVIILCSDSIPVLLLACTLQGLSYGIFFPTAVAYINQCMTPNTRVKGQAIFGVVTSGIAFGCGNMCGGWLLDAVGVGKMVFICMVIAFVGMVVVMSIPKKKHLTSAEL